MHLQCVCLLVFFMNSYTLIFIFYLDRLNDAPAVCFFIGVIYDKLHKDIFFIWTG